MKSIIQGIGVTIVVVCLVFALGWLSWLGYNYFAPKYAATQSLVFHHSPEYVHGKIQELMGLESRYDIATPAQKVMLRSVIIDEFAQYKGPLPNNLKRFYEKMEAPQ